MTKILLVEDDKSLREIYGVRLLAEGYDIISAGDGEEALAMAIKDRPALIVSDVMMPKISGFDMLDILRSTTETRDIKVIMMTALSSEDQRHRGEDLGADRYLVKSQVGIEDVVRTVHEVLGDTPPAAPSMPSPAPAAAPAPAAPAAPVPAPAPIPNLGFAPAPAPAAPAAPRDTSVAVPSRDDTPAPVAPAPTPVAPTPAPAPVPDPNDNPLPQPTAPFSTQRPAGLGDRIIQPLETPQDPYATSLADQMNQELSQGQILASAPAAAPAPMPPTPEASEAVLPPLPPLEPQQPQTEFDSVSTDEASLASHLDFEETPQSTDSETSTDQSADEPQTPPVPPTA